VGKLSFEGWNNRAWPVISYTIDNKLKQFTAVSGQGCERVSNWSKNNYLDSAQVIARTCAEP